MVVFNKIASVNRILGSDQRPLQLKEEQIAEKKKQKKPQQTFTFVDLFRYKSIRGYSWASAIIFFCTASIYYGITFSMKNIGYNIYLNMIIVVIAEFLAYSITSIFIPKVPRKLSLFLSLVFCGILSLAFISLKQAVVQLIFAAVMKYPNFLFSRFVRCVGNRTRNK